MTQETGYPPPFDPTLQYNQPLPPATPASIKVLSILAIVFGGLWTLCGTFGLVMLAVGTAGAGSSQTNPFFQSAAFNAPKSLATYNLTSGMINEVCGILLLCVGIGGIMLKPWARQLGVFWGALRLVVLIAGLAIYFAWAGPATMQMMRSTQPNNPALNLMGPSTMAIIAVVGFLLQAILPVCFLYFWTRPAVRTAFEQHGAFPSY